MGRPPALWLARAYDILADGQWRPRADVVAEMAKAVPPGKALRRGEKLKTPTGTDAAELKRRGAAHICLVSLKDSTLIETEIIDDIPMLRLAGRRPARELVTAQDALAWRAVIALAHAADTHDPTLIDTLPLTDVTRNRLRRGLDDVRML